ncbi:alpha-ketoglutarate-dependent dioxygenase AlkB family protein [Aspergillus affinis]|uniref:alpha-ketoglutarate-dependent dioxygenase AlkB family protein n=1 Tax=Aspergillus affinis TaxID=1070780 RepID=UPI0022FF397B|nr:DNA repair family protein [Aspergillus affinis]KAI9036441.1 DNA repair family protein [Aspergillus affinis]
MSKRIQSFFQPVSKKPKIDNSEPEELTRSNHATYPFPIADLPSRISNPLNDHQPRPSQSITNHPDLNLLYFQPLLLSSVARDLFHFLRAELPFYRVQYTIRRGGIDTQINTPRFTTVFGVDETSRFRLPSNPPQSDPTPTTHLAHELVDTQKHTPVSKSRYTRAPRPIPPCLDALRRVVESVSAGATYNFCLVNYYATGNDSITYHSDDERFLGAEPAIASLSLGAKRDFLMKHKPPPTPEKNPGRESRPLKFPLGSGDMIIMRGPTQANWLHSIPKRKAEVGGVGQGRINITFRKAIVPGGTDNYYHYNVGDGGVYRWSEEKGEMVLMDGERKEEGGKEAQ